MRQTSSSLEVSITKPYRNLSRRAAISFFARHKPFVGAHGEEMAVRTLTDLYRLGCYLEEEMGRLRAEYRGVKAAIDALPGGVDAGAYREARKRLRQQLREGQLGSKAYQEALQALRKRQQDFEGQVEDIRSDYVERCIPFEFFGCRIPPDVLAIIEGRADLSGSE